MVLDLFLVRRLVLYLSIVILLSWLLLPSCNSSTSSQRSTSETEGYALRYNDNIGCTYMGAWLAHVNLFRKVPFYIDICRAEAASIEVYKTAPLKYVSLDPDLFYVHHLSAYEHTNMKANGWAIALEKSLQLSQAAFTGECESVEARAEMKAQPDALKSHSLSVVPCFFGQPPNGTTHDNVRG